MNKKNVTIFISFVVILIMIVTAILLAYFVINFERKPFLLDGKERYKCIDTFGNEIYCVRIVHNYSGDYGITKDGERVLVVSVKFIEDN